MSHPGCHSGQRTSTVESGHRSNPPLPGHADMASRPLSSLGNMPRPPVRTYVVRVCVGGLAPRYLDVTIREPDNGAPLSKLASQRTGGMCAKLFLDTQSESCFCPSCPAGQRQGKVCSHLSLASMDKESLSLLIVSTIIPLGQGNFLGTLIFRGHHGRWENYMVAPEKHRVTEQQTI